MTEGRDVLIGVRAQVVGERRFLQSANTILEGRLCVEHSAVGRADPRAQPDAAGLLRAQFGVMTPSTTRSESTGPANDGGHTSVSPSSRRMRSIPSRLNGPAGPETL